MFCSNRGVIVTNYLNLLNIITPIVHVKCFNGLYTSVSPDLMLSLLMLPRKPRGEAKKCRKVYGMEKRDMWCTACRWKKACQRFTD